MNPSPGPLLQAGSFAKIAHRAIYLRSGQGWVKKISKKCRFLSQKGSFSTLLTLCIKGSYLLREEPAPLFSGWWPGQFII